MADTAAPEETDAQWTRNMRPELYIAISLLAGLLATICLSLRVYVRAFMTKSFGLDDWVLLAAYITFAAHVFLFVAYGANILRNGIESETLVSIKILEFHGLLYGLDQILIKGALASFFLKILPRSKWQRPFLLTSYWIFTIFTLAFTLLLLFQCGDPTDLLNPNPRCINDYALLVLSFTSATFNMSMDWLLTLLPISVITRTKMSRRSKTSVILLMSLGAGGSIISLLRIPFISMGLFDGTYDGFRKVTPFLFLALWENCTGIMAVSLAALRPLMRRLAGDTSVVVRSAPSRGPYAVPSSARGQGQSWPARSSVLMSDLSHSLSLSGKKGRKDYRAGKHEAGSSSQEYLGWRKDGINIATSVEVDSVKVDPEDRW